MRRPLIASPRADLRVTRLAASSPPLSTAAAAGAPPRAPARLLVALAAFAALAPPRPVAAQQCHQLSGDAWRRPGLLVGARLDAAGYRSTSFEGDYQGLAPALTFVHPRVSALAMLPAYRITRNGRTEFGLGDLALALRAPVPAWATDRLRAGFGLAVTLPTGDPGRGLGMGHVMLMPEFWWTHDWGPVQLAGVVGYGRALARAGATAHKHGPSPLVNPMNMSEVEGSLAAIVRLRPRLAVKAAAYGAAPVGDVDDPGRARLVVAQGLLITHGALELAAELQLGLLGQPFLARGVLQAGYRFDLPRRRRARRGSAAGS